MAVVPISDAPLYQAVGMRQREDGRNWTLETGQLEYYDDTQHEEEGGPSSERSSGRKKDDSAE